MPFQNFKKALLHLLWCDLIWIEIVCFSLDVFSTCCSIVSPIPTTKRELAEDILQAGSGVLVIGLQKIRSIKYQLKAEDKQSYVFHLLVKVCYTRFAHLAAMRN